MFPQLDKFAQLRAKLDLDSPEDADVFAKAIEACANNYDAFVQELRASGRFKSIPEIADFPEPPTTTMKSNLLSDRELRDYSITRAIRKALDASSRHRCPIPDGLEGEVSKALASKLPESAVKGFLVPFEALAFHAKTVNATTANAGGFLGQEMVMEPLDVLRAQSVVARGGALIFENVKQKLIFPRQGNAAVGQWLSEIGTIQSNDATWEALALAPHRLGSMVKFTKELLMLTGGTVETWARRELLGAVATAIDAGALGGTGGAQPLGIGNSALVNTITFGAAATRAKLLEMEYLVSTANAPDDNIIFVGAPLVRQKLKNVSQSSNYADWLWTDEGTIVGRPAYATNNAPGNRLVCGAFNHYTVAMFGVLDVLVNPYNEDAQGNIRVTINAFADCGELYPKSFCLSTDDANQ